MSAHQPTPGATGTATLVVSSADLASTAAAESADSGSIELPAVLSTPRMIALMELAAAKLLAPFLAPGQASVGAHVEATHSAPTPLGATITATATFKGVEGKLFVFDVVAEDAAGEAGRGTHKRAVVEVERLKKGVAIRAEKIKRAENGE
ncbi:Thioesterase superfamily [Macrophomina phaseolina MS6]|uniref:Thioesterase superfamily n=2 Tax=Macrophomina phaseolina TaxID=35725 RepID=K2S0V7_MACPH|nr:Thioesterase superfamily [Macrophomina phaseolina MS6]KAH7042791.1 putative thioesterase [Macrophomina phaseolina]